MKIDSYSMSDTDASRLQEVLKLISNENKFKIIRLLAQGEVCVCDIGEKLGIEQSLVSHHLMSLKKAKLINDRKLGTWVHYSLNKEEFSRLSHAFTKYLSSEVISDKPCCTHEECKCKIKGG